MVHDLVFLCQLDNQYIEIETCFSHFLSNIEKNFFCYLRVVNSWWCLILCLETFCSLAIFGRISKLQGFGSHFRPLLRYFKPCLYHIWIIFRPFLWHFWPYLDHFWPNSKAILSYWGLFRPYLDHLLISWICWVTQYFKIRFSFQMIYYPFSS